MTDDYDDMTDGYDDVEWTPAPPDVADRLDPFKICAGLAAHMNADELAAMRAGRLRCSLEGFDEFGLGQVSVLTVDGDLVATVQVHWSVIVLPRT
jgi:hypothetical protein